jgi:hypothetical protein
MPIEEDGNAADPHLTISSVSCRESVSCIVSLLAFSLSSLPLFTLYHAWYVSGCLVNQFLLIQSMQRDRNLSAWRFVCVTL